MSLPVELWELVVKELFQNLLDASTSQKFFKSLRAILEVRRVNTIYKVLIERKCLWINYLMPLRRRPTHAEYIFKVTVRRPNSPLWFIKLFAEAIPLREWVSLASEYGRVDVVRHLLGSHVNWDLERALRLACRYGRVEVVRLLLEAGVDVHTDDDVALCEASEMGHIEVAKILLKAGANVHARDDYALRWACITSRSDTAKVLLEAGANQQLIQEYWG